MLIYREGELYVCFLAAWKSLMREKTVFFKARQIQDNKSSIGQSRWYFRLRRKQHYVERIARAGAEWSPLKKIYEELNPGA